MKSDKLKRIQRTALTMLVIAGMINYLDRSTLSIANSSIRGELGLSATQMGLLLSAFSLSYAFAQLPIGILLDRLGARLMLGLGMFLWSVAQLAGGLVHTLQQFVVARVALGIGEAPQFPAAAKVFSEWYAVSERGRPTGISTASSTIAPELAPPLLTVLMLTLGWRGMFIVMGAAGIAAAIGWYILYRDRRDISVDSSDMQHLTDNDGSGGVQRSVTFAEWRGLLSSRTTWGLIFGFMGVIYMVWLYLTWLPAYLQQERGLTIAKSGWVLAIPYLAGTLGMVSSGIIADRLLARGLSRIASRKWPICTGLVFAALFTIPAAYTSSTSMAVVYISLAMYFINLASGGSWALVTVAAPSRLVASLGSMQNFGGYLGGSAAPLVTGMVVDSTHSFVNALLISAVISFAGALVYLLVIREPIADPADAAGRS